MTKIQPISISMLRERINVFFKKHIGTHPVYPSLSHHNRFLVSDKKIIDIVLMGDVLTILTSLKFEKETPLIRLWCLSIKHAELVSKKFDIPLTHIGIIPRYELFPVKRRPRKFPKINEPITLVLASRWTVQKNNQQALLFADQLRNQWKGQVRIVHTFPSEKEKELAERFLRDSSLREIEVMKLGENWPSILERKYVNPVFLNLSSDIFEDFGVSLAQAEALGWPSILSAWAAHFDAVRSWRVYLSHFSVKGLPSPVAPASKPLKLTLPEVIMFDETLFKLDKKTMLELIFSRQLKTPSFDKELRTILGNLS